MGRVRLSGVDACIACTAGSRTCRRPNFAASAAPRSARPPQPCRGRPRAHDREGPMSLPSPDRLAGVIFDLDGTLTDSWPVALAAFRAALAKYSSEQY